MGNEQVSFTFDAERQIIVILTFQLFLFLT